MKTTLLVAIISFLCYASSGQTISTIAGTGIAGFSGDGFVATNAKVHAPAHFAVDGCGNIFVTDYTNHVIRKIDRLSGIITTVAGTGLSGFSGNYGPATLAQLNSPNHIAFDTSGNLYVADMGNNMIRKIDVFGIITTVAGTGSAGYWGDGGPATAAKLNGATGVDVDRSGNIFISDYGNHRIRKVNIGGIINTIVGTGVGGFNGDGIPATSAQINVPTTTRLDATGNLFFVDQFNNRIRKVNTAGIISTVAGAASGGTYAGDNGPATMAQLHYPSDLRIAATGNIFIADAYNNAIRMVDAAGFITTVAGTGISGYTGDGVAATASKLNQPWGLVLDDCGNLYIADALNNRVRKVDMNAIAPISGPDTVHVGATISLKNIVGCGTWTSSATSVATVGSVDGIVAGHGKGIANITYSNYCGSAMYSVSVLSLPSTQVNSQNSDNIKAWPNPADRTFTITGFIHENLFALATIEIFNVIGQSIFRTSTQLTDGRLNESIALPEHTPAGLYFIRVSTGFEQKVIRLQIQHQ